MISTLQNRQLPKNDETFSDRKQRIYNFLQEQPVGVLSTVGPDGDPHGVVIYYGVNKQLLISFLTRAETRKYDDIKHHNHVMLTVFEPHSQTTAQITGRAIEITDNYAINAVAATMLKASLKTSEAGIPPIAKLKAGAYVAFKIDPVQIRMTVYARPDSGGHTKLFETVESFELHDRGN